MPLKNKDEFDEVMQGIIVPLLATGLRAADAMGLVRVDQTPGNLESRLLFIAKAISEKMEEIDAGLHG